MKQISFIALFIFLSYTAIGQKVRFTDSTNRWHYSEFSAVITGFPVTHYIDSFYGDTSIHGTHYQRLRHNYSYFGGFTPGFAYIREDTIAKQIFAIYPEYPDYDTTEQLMYDYTLQVGDTFRSKHAVHFVQSIDSVSISGIWHLIWDFQWYSWDSTATSIGVGAENFIVIEGIGSIFQPCTPLNPLFFEIGNILTCFNTRNTTPGLSHDVYVFNNTTSCDKHFLYLESGTTRNIQVAPNPITSLSKIILPENVKFGTLIVVNNVGQQVINMEFNNKDEILINGLVQVPGVYFFRIIDNHKGIIYTGKFAY